MENYLPLLIFTLFGGLSAGSFVISLIPRLTLARKAKAGVGSELSEASGSDKLSGGDKLSSGDSESPTGSKSSSASEASIKLLSSISLIALAIGLVATLLHLGQPFRFLNGLSNPGSMISQESYWGMALFALLLTSVIVVFVKKVLPLGLQVLAALAGIGLMIVTALAYYKSIGIPAWHDGAVIPLFVLGDLLLGAALCSVVFSSEKTRVSCLRAVLGLSLLSLVAVFAFGTHIQTIGSSSQVILLAVGSGIGLLASAVVAVLSVAGKLDKKVASAVTLILVIIGIVIIRIAFFAAGVHL
jgi:DMSO reductase anchor subunit